jgi:hypothetical protein
VILTEIPGNCGPSRNARRCPRPRYGITATRLGPSRPRQSPHEWGIFQFFFARQNVLDGRRTSLVELLRILPTVLFSVVDGVGAHERLRRLVAEERVERVPVLEVIKRQPKQIILSAFACMAEQTPAYIYLAFVFTYGTQVVVRHAGEDFRQNLPRSGEKSASPSGSSAPEKLPLPRSNL